ncbi:uncharacterized protein C8Q71DRAFT_727006 [Rhodofomes roseus]|uniref:Uncharacterized protein n=1 Tax=Rhodofomes roseus TaxID=34475 RepID=A0ABQ8K2X1_9APHY|nr:uncharacterized protein C8Q71DRAFT_727006 [Rhodofomes roseus]KAH9831177.1 hypothetical protein C8Q71DRAFT_727006 [Rhodofomes roseus]
MQQNVLPLPHEPTSPPGESTPSPSIMRLRDASLVKTAAKRINAEPIALPSANPWKSPRATSPVDNGGKSYADVVATAANTPPRETTPTLEPATPTQQPQSPVVKTEQDENIILQVTTVEPLVLTDKDGDDTEAQEMNEPLDPDVSRTRSGKVISSSKSKAKKTKAKKNVKKTEDVLALGEGLPTSLQHQVETPIQQATGPSRIVSESRKRRRVTTDIDDGESNTTVNRTQDAPVVPPLTPAKITVRRSSPLSYLDDTPPKDRHDPPAITTSDLETSDIEMIDLDDEAVNRTLHRPNRPPANLYAHHVTGTTGPNASSSSKREGKRPARHEDFDGITSQTGPASGGPPHTHYSSASHNRAAQGDPEAPLLYMHERGPQLDHNRPPTHPRPVHYAPGPFPLLPDEQAQAMAPLPTLPQPMALTRPPPDGHVQIQGNDPYFFLHNILVSQRSSWSTLKDIFLFIQFPGRGAQDSGNHARMSSAETVLTKYLDIYGSSLIQPLPETTQTKPNEPPHWYRLGNLTQQGRDKLIKRVWWSAPEGTFSVIDPDGRPPTYIGTWRDAHRLGSTSEAGMAIGFRATLCDDQAAHFIKSILVDEYRRGRLGPRQRTDDTFDEIIRSVRVRKFMWKGPRNGEEEPVASLYIDSPTRDAAEWAVFKTYLRQLTYGGAHAGPPELIVDAFFCAYCHSIDHPTYACTVPLTPGWHGPSLEAARESITNERRGMEAGNGRGRGRGGRGRGGRGRGRGGPRGRGGV